MGFGIHFSWKTGFTQLGWAPDEEPKRTVRRSTSSDSGYSPSHSSSSTPSRESTREPEQGNEVIRQNSTHRVYRHPSGYVCADRQPGGGNYKVLGSAFDAKSADNLAEDFFNPPDDGT